MQAVDTEMCVIKRQSMDRRCDVLLRVHDYTGCSSIALSYDTLRKRLAEAVREYGYLMAAHTDYRALGVSEYPEGLLSDCGGCWKAAQASSQVPTQTSSHQFCCIATQNLIFCSHRSLPYHCCS